MNQVEYLALDLYDQNEVESTLKFAPYFHWKLLSIQDVYSRSDVYRSSSYGQKVTPQIYNKSWGGNFSEAVNSSGLSPYDESHEKNTETHIVDYTKMVWQRDPSFPERARIRPLENSWIKMNYLLKRIGQKAEQADFSKTSGAYSHTGNGAFIWGLILLVLGGLAFGLALYLKNSMPETVEAGSIYAFTNYINYAGIGLLILGGVIFLIALFIFGHSNHIAHRSKKIIHDCVKDYREIKKAKRSFEDLVMKGVTPQVNNAWLDKMLNKYCGK